ncbi:MAG: polysaccharide biosynthesis/export family protein, partial [Acidobacteria bacterium]|nr:polysaccharide biosynthesis/export family protein [Acidobacteriota bacterium]
MLLELKRWVAKTATDHGQIVDESDLGDQAIFSRLSSDLEFRALATRLLQRYGHLVPKPVPGSEAAQELLRQEKVRQAERSETEGSVAVGDQQGLRSRGRVAPRRRAATYPTEVPSGNPLEESEIRARKLILSGLQPDAGAGHRVDAALNAVEEGTRDLSSGENRPARQAEFAERGALSPPVAEPGPYRRNRPASPSAEKAEDLDRTTVLHKANPYADIPSLYDMYTQVSARPPVLGRFGMDVFRNATGDADLLPMDLPAGPDYVVGPGDGLAINLWGGVAQRLYRIVDREGRLSLPEVGPILVNGRTMGEVQQAVQQILRTQFRDITADVSLSRLRTIRVYVVGDVEQPGAY